MRLSIIALASFIICGVFASPILSGRGSDNGLSLSRRGPGKTTPKTTPKTSGKQTTGKQPTGNKPTGKQPTGTGKQPPGKQPQTKGAPPKSCPMRKKINKRTDAEVEAAVNHAIVESKKTKETSTRKGRGAGKAFPINFKGQDAFIKLIKEKDQTTRKAAENEAKCSDAVGQYLAWAVKEGKDLGDGKKEPTLYFVITKKMGDTQDSLIEAHKDKKLKPADFLPSRPIAVKHYKDTYGAVNGDLDQISGNNFVYSVDVSGEEPKVTAQIIDWEHGTLDKEHAVPKPVEIAADC